MPRTKRASAIQVDALEKANKPEAHNGSSSNFAKPDNKKKRQRLKKLASDSDEEYMGAEPLKSPIQSDEEKDAEEKNNMDTDHEQDASIENGVVSTKSLQPLIEILGSKEEADKELDALHKLYKKPGRNVMSYSHFKLVEGNDEIAVFALAHAWSNNSKPMEAGLEERLHADFYGVIKFKIVSKIWYKKHSATYRLIKVEVDAEGLKQYNILHKSEKTTHEILRDFLTWGANNKLSKRERLFKGNRFAIDKFKNRCTTESFFIELEKMYQSTLSLHKIYIKEGNEFKIHFRRMKLTPTEDELWNFISTMLKKDLRPVFLQDLTTQLENTEFEGVISFADLLPVRKTFVEGSVKTEYRLLLRAVVNEQKLTALNEKNGKNETVKEVLQRFQKFMLQENKPRPISQHPSALPAPKQTNSSNILEFSMIPLYGRISAAFKNNRADIKLFHRAAYEAFNTSQEQKNILKSIHWENGTQLAISVLGISFESAKNALSELQKIISLSNEFKNAVKFSNITAITIDNIQYYITYIEAKYDTLKKLYEVIQKNTFQRDLQSSGEGYVYLLDALRTSGQPNSQNILDQMLETLHKKYEKKIAQQLQHPAMIYSKELQKNYIIIEEDTHKLFVQQFKQLLIGTIYQNKINLSGLPIAIKIQGKSYLLIQLQGDAKVQEAFNEWLQTKITSSYPEEEKARTKNVVIMDETESSPDSAATIEQKYPLGKMPSESAAPARAAAASPSSEPVDLQEVEQLSRKEKTKSSRGIRKGIKNAFTKEADGQYSQAFETPKEARRSYHHLMSSTPADVKNIVKIYIVGRTVYIGANKEVPPPVKEDHEAAFTEWKKAVNRKGQKINDLPFTKYDAERGMLYYEYPNYSTLQIQRRLYVLNNYIKKLSIEEWSFKKFVECPNRIYFAADVIKSIEQCNNKMQELHTACQDKSNLAKRQRDREFSQEEKGNRKGQFFCFPEKMLVDAAAVARILNSGLAYTLKKQLVFESDGNKVYIVSKKENATVDDHIAAHQLWKEEQAKKLKHQRLHYRKYQFDETQKRFYTTVVRQAVGSASNLNSELKSNPVFSTLKNVIKFVPGDQKDGNDWDRVYVNALYGNDHQSVFEQHLKPLLKHEEQSTDDKEMSEEDSSDKDELDFEIESEDEFSKELREEKQVDLSNIKKRSILNPELRDAIQKAGKNKARLLYIENKLENYASVPEDSDPLLADEKVKFGRHFHLYYQAFADEFQKLKNSQPVLSSEQAAIKGREHGELLAKQHVSDDTLSHEPAVSTTDKETRLIVKKLEVFDPRQPYFVLPKAQCGEKIFHEYYLPAFRESYGEAGSALKINKLEIVVVANKDAEELAKKIASLEGSDPEEVKKARAEYKPDDFNAYYRQLQNQFAICYNAKKKFAEETAKRVCGELIFHTSVLFYKNPRNAETIWSLPNRKNPWFKAAEVTLGIHFELYYTTIEAIFKSRLEEAEIQGKHFAKLFAYNFCLLDPQHPIFQKTKEKYKDSVLWKKFTTACNEHYKSLLKQSNIDEMHKALLAEAKVSALEIAKSLVASFTPYNEKDPIFNAIKEKYLGQVLGSFFESCEKNYRDLMISLTNEKGKLAGKNFAAMETENFPGERDDIFTVPRKLYREYFSTYYQAAKTEFEIQQKKSVVEDEVVDLTLSGMDIDSSEQVPPTRERRPSNAPMPAKFPATQQAQPQGGSAEVEVKVSASASPKPSYAAMATLLQFAPRDTNRDKETGYTSDAKKQGAVDVGMDFTVENESELSDQQHAPVADMLGLNVQKNENMDFTLDGESGLSSQQHTPVADDELAFIVEDDVPAPSGP